MVGDEPRELVLELPELRLRALAWGDPSDPPLLALHGWLDNAASFAGLAPLLPGLNLVALDLSGHGRSEHRPAGWRHHFVDWVDEVVSAADVLGWSRFALLGHSMGAGIASLLPATMPRRVERLVLLEGAGPMTAPAEEAPDRLAAALAAERTRRVVSHRVFPSLDTAVAARRRGTELDDGAARLLVERGTEAEPAAGIRFRHDPRLRLPTRLRMTEDQVLAFMRRIGCPVLAVRASDGWPFPEAYLRGRLDAMPQVQRLDVEGDHHVHLTHPERVAPAIRRFLSL